MLKDKYKIRFDHLTFGAFKTLGDENMVKGMSHINHPNQLCEACVFDKHERRRLRIYFLKQKSKACKKGK
ncbi:hypothetical protein CR513_46340, partial [Mucuna pruriens]